MTLTAHAPVTAGDIVTAAATLLLDDAHTRWPVAEKTKWINEAMSAILWLRPQAFTKTQVMDLVAGTLQNLPLGSTMFLSIIRNIASDGVTPGRVVRGATRQSIDDADPNWHNRPASATIRQFMQDEKTPLSFYVYPPAVAGSKVEIQHAVLPVSVAAQTDTLDIAPEYISAVTNYVAYRCNLKDSEYADATAANLYYQAFLASLGLNPTTGAAQ